MGIKNNIKISALLVLSFLILATIVFANNDTVNITVYVNTAPNITYVNLDDYNPSVPTDTIDLIAGANATVYCIVNVTEPDGYDTINQSTLNVTIYNQANGTASANPKFVYSLIWNNTTNTNACLNQSRGGGATSNGWIYYNCSVGFVHYAENGTWVCYAQIYDNASTRLRANNTDIANVTQLIALNISTPLINFGLLSLGDNITSAGYNATIENIGNVPLRVNVTSSWNASQPLNDTYAMICNSGYINESDVYFKDTGIYSGPENILTWTKMTRGFNTASNMSLNESMNTARVYFPMFFGLYLNQSTNLNPRGTCNGWLFFDALIG